jgi:hypothetical protein
MYWPPLWLGRLLQTEFINYYYDSKQKKRFLLSQPTTLEASIRKSADES